ncbi:MAG: fructosamine kinase family protein [Actinomycetota bacterium]
MRGRLDPVVAADVAAALDAEVSGGTALGGGDVAASFRLELADGRTVFAKTKAGASPEFFLTEAEGLRWLREPEALAVPEVLAVGEERPLLVLAWIDETGRRPGSDVAFGRALAALHRSGAPCFGRADRRTTGSRDLPNEPRDTWAASYADNRLRPLARLATDTGSLPAATIEGLASIADRLEALAPAEEPPARLHGDLWAGNRLVDVSGRNWLIDPAAHGGHREFDLAMMRLFGGWAEDAFAAYHEVWPLADGWADRVALHQLAPLAVHAVKFGGGYVGATSEAVDRYR